jgi:hypothetical protein
VDCIALYDSGNYAYRICRVFEEKGIIFEVISTPCRVTNTGCGYCLLFPEAYLDQVIAQSKFQGCPVRGVYRIVLAGTKKNYVRIM